MTQTEADLWLSRCAVLSVQLKGSIRVASLDQVRGVESNVFVKYLEVVLKKKQTKASSQPKLTEHTPNVQILHLIILHFIHTHISNFLSVLRLSNYAKYKLLIHLQLEAKRGPSEWKSTNLLLCHLQALVPFTLVCEHVQGSNDINVGQLKNKITGTHFAGVDAGYKTCT